MFLVFLGSAAGGTMTAACVFVPRPSFDRSCERLRPVVERARPSDAFSCPSPEKAFSVATPEASLPATAVEVSSAVVEKEACLSGRSAKAAQFRLAGGVARNAATPDQKRDQQYDGGTP